MTVPASINPLFFDAASGGYQISRSLRFRSSASAYLSRTFASGNRQTWTWSGWLKRGALGSSPIIFQSAGAGGFGVEGFISFNSDAFAIQFDYNGGSRWQLITTAVYRDPSAFYHLVVVADTTNATSGDRLRLYVNGSRVTAFSTSSYPTQNANGTLNQAYSHAISARVGPSDYFDGYLAEVNFIDGQALDPTSFGAYDTTTGVWGPKKYTGTYGTNGFYLNFSDNSGATSTTIGKDSSGNSNNWTPNNISVTSGTTYDSMIDSPTPYADGGNGRGNYATWNPLFGGNGSYLSQANLNFETASAYKATISTIGLPNSGLWYVEGTIKATGGSSSIVTFGVAKQNVDPNALGYNTANAWSVTSETTFYAVVNGTASQSWSSGRWVTGEVARLAIDMNNGRMWVGNSTVWFGSTSNSTNGDPVNGTNPTITGLPSDLFVWTSAYANGVNINFGQRPFSLTPPSGFSALNTQNLPTPTIKNGAQYMAAVTYTGTGSLTTRTGLALSTAPGLIWIKGRSTTSDQVVEDSLTGTSVVRFTNLTNGDGATGGGWIQNFSTTGFSTDINLPINTNGATYVAWAWAGGGTGVTNTSGSITSQVSANVSAGFSIVTYTGTGANATVGHGLGVAPSMIIVKSKDYADNWYIYNTSIGNTKYLLLNGTQAAAVDAKWNNTTPTSSVFSLGGAGYGVNGNGNSYVAYCFAPVAGYSAFGSYTGNNSADGPFVYLGFRPRFLMIKDTTSAGAWWIGDSSRATNNVVAASLFPNTSGAESSTYDQCDFLSNGFKWRANSANSWPNNVSGNTYIYAAFAENPFKISRAR